jgi:adenylate cyclase
MSEQAPRRRLAAILAADVVGYSRMMQADEAGTLAALKARREEILQPLVSKHRGRVVKLVGDGVLIEFASAVNAVECAVQLRKDMSVANAALPEDRRIVLRIGINIGDVIVEGGDLDGDGVNIAARLEALAEPGSVVVSEKVRQETVGKLALSFEDLGEQTLKNMAESVRLYRVDGNGEAAAGLAAQPSKPSVAVLPFANMSGDPEQEYFSDGITEDIITDLSKVAALNVLSRNTVFTFKGKAVDVAKIARQLKVGHVVEGSVRKADGRVRITAQLIDAARDSHVWDERYDRVLSDIFALQDEISQAIVAALKVKLLPEEKKAIERRSTHDTDAYELYLLGWHYHQQRGAKSLEIAVRFCQRALEIDQNYARAWALIALCQSYLYLRGRSQDSGLAAAEKALALDPSLGEAYAAKGRALAEIGRYEEAMAAHEKSLRLEPGSFDVQYSAGRTCYQFSRHEDAVEHFERAAQILETDYFSPVLAGQAYEILGRTEEAARAMRHGLERIETEIANRPDNVHAIVQGACALAFLGEWERAKQWARRAMTIDPDDSVDQYNLGCALARMNETEQALDVLESCQPRTSPESVNWMKTDPDLASLHDHPRFKALIACGEARLAAAQAEQSAEARESNGASTK